MRTGRSRPTLTERLQRRWLDAPRPLRFVGGTFDDAWPAQGSDVQASRLAAEFDALLFVADSTPSRLTSPSR